MSTSILQSPDLLKDAPQPQLAAPNPPNPPNPPCRLLLLVDQRENRRLLAEALAMRYEVLEADSDAAIEQEFDLCLIDGHALARLQGTLQMRKAAEQPVFLPVLLATARHGVGLLTRHLWESVDEVIVAPIEKAELQARVEVLLRARRLSRENALLLRQLEAELQRAASVQAALLPSATPQLQGFELAARSLAAREVGGDFYDWMRTDADTLTFTVGDAMGRGMSAALLMATVRAALRTVIERHPPAEALALVRKGLEEDFVNAGFVTLFHAALHEPSRTLRFVDAGHAHLFVLHGDGSFENLKPRCPALGIPVPKPFVEGQFIFAPGDSLIVYTDGILDAHPETDLTHADLAALLQSATSAGEMVARLLELARTEEPQPDDVTAAVLRCTG